MSELIVNNTTASAARANRAALVKNVRIWVGQTFLGTLMKQMRDSPFKSDLFSGGRGGDVFAGLLDQHLAERMSRGVAEPLVNSIVRRIERAHPSLFKDEAPDDPYRELRQNVRTHVAPDPGH